MGLMMKKVIARNLQSLSVGHSDTLMSVHLPVQDNKFATIISGYAPTLQADINEKVAFYAYLRNLLLKVEKLDKVVVKSNFNA